jgi:hypothetical protein
VLAGERNIAGGYIHASEAQIRPQRRERQQQPADAAAGIHDTGCDRQALDHRRQPVEVLVAVVGLRRVSGHRPTRVLHHRQLSVPDTIERVRGASEHTGEQSNGGKRSQDAPSLSCTMPARDVHASTVASAIPSLKKQQNSRCLSTIDAIADLGLEALLVVGGITFE